MLTTVLKGKTFKRTYKALITASLKYNFATILYYDDFIALSSHHNNKK